MNSNRKGKNAEREIAQIINEALAAHHKNFCKPGPAPQVRRNLDQARDGGCDLIGLAGVAIEVKDHVAVNVSPWWAQTVRQAGDHSLPVLIYKARRGVWRVRLPVTLPVSQNNSFLFPGEVSLPDFLTWLCFRVS